MKNVMIVGAARDARTRTKRAQAGARRRRVRIGGIHRVRPNRSISLSPAQCMEYEADLRACFKDGLILFQDVDGRPVSLEMVFGGKASAPPEMPAPSEPEPEPEPEAEPEPEPEPEAEPEPEPEATEPEATEPEAEPLPEGYADFTKRELLTLFEGRLDVPENTRNATLIEALAAWEDENFE